MKSFILIIVFWSSFTFANLNGKWTGFGEWTYQGSGTRCYMNLNFSDTQEELSRGESLFDCDVVAMNVLAAKFHKQGSLLLDDNGEEVGTYSNNKITITEEYSDSVNIETTIIVDGNHLDYVEIWLDSNKQEIYKIHGRLFSSR